MGRRGWGGYRGYDNYGGWPEYVPAAQRRANAIAHARRLEKEEGRTFAPIRLEGRTIAKSFWGKAWCDNLEAYSDFANRLPRGKTYLRNGSVIDLQIAKGKITALVSGSDIYEIAIAIDTLPTKAWREISRDCAQSISSLVNLLQGRFERGVMERLTRREGGLFPKPKEIRFECSCPDYAGICKHLAAVMYGVGARLEHSPELLFTLRNVDHLDLIGQAVAAENLEHALFGEADPNLASSDLGQMFGIELESLAADANDTKQPPARGKRAKATRTSPKAPARQSSKRAEKKPLKSRSAQAKRTIAAPAEKRARKPAARVVETALALAKANSAKKKAAHAKTKRAKLAAEKPKSRRRKAK